MKWIQYQPPANSRLNAAVDLVGVPAAWSAIGGSANAGAGVQASASSIPASTRPIPASATRASRAPAGFPKGDTAYTNNKVIVARSYVAIA